MLFRSGLAPGRTLHQMRRSLPLSIADAAHAVEVRSFVKGHDEDEWLDLNNRAFAHHPEQGGWDRATLSTRMAQPWFDAEGFVVHEIDGRMAGFCWTKVHRDTDPVLGEIGVAFVVAVDPASPPTLEELREWCRDRLADYKSPDRLVVVPELPVNATHKIDKTRLATLAKEHL